QIAGRPAALARLALAGQLEPRAGIDAGRHLDVEYAFGLHLARAATGCARVGHHLAGARAGAAGARDLEEALRHPQLAGAVARRAGLGVRAGLRARAHAGGALLVAGDLDLRLGAEGRLGEADLQVVPEVRAAGLAAAAGAPALSEDL